MFVGPGGLSYRSRSSSDVRSPQLQRRREALQQQLQQHQQQQRLERQHPLITSPAKRARSYLTDEVRQQFEQAAATGQQQEPPQKNSFVKRLVATLERRYSDEQLVPLNRPACKNNSCRKELTRQTPSRTADRGATTTSHETPKTPSRVEQLDRTVVLSRLDEVSERDEEDYWCPEEELDDSSPISAWSPSSAVSETLAKQQRPRGHRRIFRSVLSSIMRWKPHKQLPTGTRAADEYYSARPSLGEEMRAFRQHTMPQLFERADAQAATPPMLIEQQRQREFDQMIASPRVADDEPSTATIRPVYGNKQHARLSWQLEDDLLEDYNFVEQQQQQPIQCYSSSLPSRPCSRRSSREDSDVFAGVQLRKPFVATPTANGTNNNNNNNISSSKNKNTKSDPHVVYDVPRFLDSTPIYENVSAAINPGNDERLQRTVFTTFRLS